MRYLSICAGIEAASAAWHGLGWQPVGFAEIEDFPAAVLKHRFPEVKNFGDMTKFEEWDVGSIDILVGGTPCQAFSVAGLRGGLADARGNLTLTFVEMADHFDPEWIVWENVPGVLSSQDNAFGCFLAGLVGASEPLIPDGRWDNAGVVSGPKRTAAWRVLDAQYFGVAQRRRRVFVCAVRGARNWAAARAFFPVGESVYRDSPPRREAREGVAPTVSSGAPFSRTGNERVESQALVTDASRNLDVDCIGTLTVGFGKLGAPEIDAYTAIPAQPLCFKVRGGVEREDGSRGSVNVGKQAGKGYLGSTERAFTVASTQDQWVAQPITFGAQMSTPQTDVDLVQTLQAKNPMAVAQPVAFTTKLHNTASNQSGKVYEEYTTALDRSSPPPALLTDMQVRRLTPTECERLQGFSDGWTNIPWRGKPEAPDGPRYKALGNSMAVPCMRWIGERIQLVQEGRA